MKNIIKTDFFSESKRWNRRIPTIKKISLKTVKEMIVYFKKNHLFYINLILSDKTKIKTLNKKFKNKYNDTDVLTFVSKFSNKELGKKIYCDIFFSIDTIDNFVKNNEVNIYDHFNHLLIHSFLHINGYDHNTMSKFKKMKKQEIKILKKFGIEDPYINS